MGKDCEKGLKARNVQFIFLLNNLHLILLYKNVLFEVKIAYLVFGLHF